MGLNKKELADTVKSDKIKLPTESVLSVATGDGEIQIPINKRRLTTETIIAQLQNALSTEYTGADPAKEGLTKGAAALLSIAERAQDGDIEATEFLLNRFMGKPVQQVNNMSVTGSLKDFLEVIRQDSSLAPPPPDVIDADIKSDDIINRNVQHSVTPNAKCTDDISHSGGGEVFNSISAVVDDPLGD